MSEFRDRLAEAIPTASMHGGPNYDVADRLIESGVVADPADVRDPDGYIDGLADKYDEAMSELAELRKYVAGVKNAHTARQADAWDDCARKAYGLNLIHVVARDNLFDMNPYRAEPETTP